MPNALSLPGRSACCPRPRRDSLKQCCPARSALNLWPYLAGRAPKSPREQVLLGTGATAINGIVADDGEGGLWKRLEGTVKQ